jgi:hypothetical protein
MLLCTIFFLLNIGTIFVAARPAAGLSGKSRLSTNGLAELGRLARAVK